MPGRLAVFHWKPARAPASVCPSQSVARCAGSLGALTPILGSSLTWSKVERPQQRPDCLGSMTGATQTILCFIPTAIIAARSRSMTCRWTSGVTGSFLTVVLPRERLLVGPGDPGRRHELHEVCSRVLDPREGRVLDAGEERHGALLDPVRALGTGVGVDLGAVLLLKRLAEPSERGGLSRRLLPDDLDSRVDLLPDERLLEDARTG